MKHQIPISHIDYLSMLAFLQSHSIKGQGHHSCHTRGTNPILIKQVLLYDIIIHPTTILPPSYGVVRSSIKVYDSHTVNLKISSLKDYAYYNHMRNTYDTHMTSHIVFSWWVCPVHKFTNLYPYVNSISTI